MPQLFKLPLVLTAQLEGGYTVTSPALPELLTEGDTADEAITNVADALSAVIELYDDLGKPMPPGPRQNPDADEITFEGVVVAA